MKKILLAASLAAIFTAGGLHAQIIPVGTIYESSQSAGNVGAQNLFDGTGLATSNTTPPVASATSTNGQYAAYATIGYGAGVVNNDINPIVAFNLGSTYTASSVDYSQRGGGSQGGNGADSIVGGTVYALSLAQYTAFTGNLLVSNDSAAANEGAAVTAPTSFLGSATFTISNNNSGAAGYDNFALSGNVTGQYYVVQFNGNKTAADNLGGNPGGDEFELVGTATPEPSTYALMAIGLGAMVFSARRRLTA